MTNEITSTEWPGHNLGAEIEQQVGELKVDAEEWRLRAAKSARRALSAADDYVHKNPWPVIGSVAIGFLALGFLLARRRD